MIQQINNITDLNISINMFISFMMGVGIVLLGVTIYILWKSPKVHNYYNHDDIKRVKHLDAPHQYWDEREHLRDIKSM